MIVYVLARSPWGPVRIEAAADMGELLRTATDQPAHIEDMGKADAGDIAASARGKLAPASPDGWIEAKPAAAVQAVKEARHAVLAMVVAEPALKAAPGPPVSHGGAMAANGNVLARVRERYSPTRPVTDVRAIREGLGLSQGKFAQSFGVSLHTIQDWEQGRSRPDQTARAFLRVIAARPDVVREVLALRR